MNKTWFITGASRGFGRIWAEAALKRGDQVTATARKLADVADLKERFGDAVLRSGMVQPRCFENLTNERFPKKKRNAFSRFSCEAAKGAADRVSWRTTQVWITSSYCNLSDA
jgi:NAD(P)-dependent dehydrogenase (short-subunit alcohol dehydrogenase family)